jgi:hypothetical protein
MHALDIYDTTIAFLLCIYLIQMAIYIYIYLLSKFTFALVQKYIHKKC